MAIIIGQVGSGKELRRQLDQCGLSHFKSIGDIKRFTESFESIKKEIFEKHSNYIKESSGKLKERNFILEESISSGIQQRREKLGQEFEQLKKKLSRNFFGKNAFNNLFNALIAYSSYSRFRYLEKRFDFEARQPFQGFISEFNNNLARLNEIEHNSNAVISESASNEMLELNRTSKVIDELSLVISGCIGEQKVSEKIRELPDDFVLINDFALSFNPPIYNKKENDRIFSIQLDHVLIGKSGVFLLETKNWSKKSVESSDLYSPAKQISRSGYAFYKVLNGALANGELRLNAHHWGDKKISTKNIIVMINNRPQVDIQFVKILSLEELLRYIKYFPDVYSQNEVNAIAGFLKKANSGSI